MLETLKTACTSTQTLPSGMIISAPEIGTMCVKSVPNVQQASIATRMATAAVAKLGRTIQQQAHLLALHAQLADTGPPQDLVTVHAQQYARKEAIALQALQLQ